MPHVLTVFRSRLRPENVDEYAATAARMDELARAMPGFVDAKTFTADDGERVTVVTFEDVESQRAWRDHAEHREAQRRGIERFYSEYAIQVADVRYSHEFHHDD
jgi:heme-degrading monooxygenase HmoA